MNRRTALRLGATALASAALPLLGWCGAARKQVLVLGGTWYLGPATVQSLLAQGHAVTLFNRGKSNPELFPVAEKLRGDRDPKSQNLAALLGNRRWDAVIDVWPAEPDIVEATARLLAPRTSHYLYVSSVSAYDGYPKPAITEDFPIRAWKAADADYGENKAESERRLHSIVGDKLTIVRPGPIMGQRGGSPDLVTWVLRARSGGPHIAPGDGSDSVEFVDVKDVGDYLVTCVDQRRLGTWNLTGTPISFHDFLAHCNASIGASAEWVWIPQPFLAAHGLLSDKALNVYAGNFPLWRPEPEITNIYRISSARAFAAGWQPRPFHATVQDALATFHAVSATPPTWKDFMDAAREAEVLRAWQARA